VVKAVKYLIVGFLMVASTVSAVAKNVDTIESHGIYVVADKGYVKIEHQEAYRGGDVCAQFSH
jgi:hypothetical protein